MSPRLILFAIAVASAAAMAVMETWVIFSQPISYLYIPGLLLVIVFSALAFGLWLGRAVGPRKSKVIKLRLPKAKAQSAQETRAQSERDAQRQQDEIEQQQRAKQRRAEEHFGSQGEKVELFRDDRPGTRRRGTRADSLNRSRSSSRARAELGAGSGPEDRDSEEGAGAGPPEFELELLEPEEPRPARGLPPLRLGQEEDGEVRVQRLPSVHPERPEDSGEPSSEQHNQHQNQNQNGEAEDEDGEPRRGERREENRVRRRLKLLLQRFFQGLPPGLVDELFESLVWLELDPGDRLYDFGDAADEGAFVVVSGELAVFGRQNMPDFKGFLRSQQQQQQLSQSQQPQQQSAQPPMRQDEDGVFLTRRLSDPSIESLELRSPRNPNLSPASEPGLDTAQPQQREDEEDCIELYPAYPGDLLGDAELLLGIPRLQRAEVRGSSVCTLLQLRRPAYRELCARSPALGVSFARTTVARLWRLGSAVISDFLRLPLPAVFDERNGIPEPRVAAEADSSSALSVSLAPLSLDGSAAGSEQASAQPPTLSHAASAKFAAAHLELDLEAMVRQHPELVLSLGPGDRLNHKSSRKGGESLYVIISGKMRIKNSSKQYETLGRGRILNSVAFVTQDPLSRVPAVASTGCRVFRFPQTELDAERPHPFLAALCAVVARALTRFTARFKLLGFRHELRRAGSILFQRGDLGSLLYVVVSGKVRVYAEPEPDFVSWQQQDQAKEDPDPHSSFHRLEGQHRGVIAGLGEWSEDAFRAPEDSKSNARWLSQENIRLEVGRGMCVGEGAFLRGGGPEAASAFSWNSAVAGGLPGSSQPPEEEDDAEAFRTPTLGPRASPSLQPQDEEVSRSARKQPAKRARALRLSDLGEATPHSFTAVTVRDAELVSIGRGPFWVLLARFFPGILGRFTQILAERMGQLMSSEQLRNQGRRFGSQRVSCTTVAVIPGDDSVDAEAFCEKLQRALQLQSETLVSGDRSVLRVSSGLVDRWLGFGHTTPAQPARTSSAASTQRPSSAATTTHARQTENLPPVLSKKDGHALSDDTRGLSAEPLAPDFGDELHAEPTLAQVVPAAAEEGKEAAKPASSSSAASVADHHADVRERSHSKASVSGRSQAWTYTQRSRAVAWLSEQERTHRFVLFQAGRDRGDLFWTRLCVRSADCVFVIVDSGSSAEGLAREVLQQTKSGGASSSSSSATSSNTSSNTSAASSASSVPLPSASSSSSVEARKRGSAPGVSELEHELLWASDAGVRNLAPTPTAAEASLWTGPPLKGAQRRRNGRRYLTFAGLRRRLGRRWRGVRWGAAGGDNNDALPALASDPATDIQASQVHATASPQPASSSQQSNSSAQVVSFASKELVLVHPRETLIPRGTRQHLDCRPGLDRHHHVREDLDAHFNRLARYLSGNTVCTVLGGGGARGLSHLGTMEALIELGISVDGAGGCSQGAFMAALLALQPDLSKDFLPEIRSMTQRMAGRLGSIAELLRDATLPLMSYFRGERFSKSIAEILGEDVQIEDCWIPFFCVTTNISKGDITVHQRDSLWRAVRASMSILDYMPPMWVPNPGGNGDSGSLLVDGGYIDNLPVDVCRRIWSPGHVIAVDVENKNELHLQNISRFGDSLSGWEIVLRRLQARLPGGAPFQMPRFHEILGSLVYLHHNRNLRHLIGASLIDCYIRPGLGDTALLDYDKLEGITRIGYEASIGLLREYKRRRMNSGSSNSNSHVSIQDAPLMR